MDERHLLELPKPLRWLYLDLNSYFASVEQQVQPRLRGRPVAVTPTHDTDATCAIAASYEAKALGVKTGMAIYEAKKVCPDLMITPARHDVYVDYHHRIMDEIDRHIPLTQICSIDEVACRLWDNERNLEDALILADRIKRAIRENVGDCLRSSVGLGPSQLLAKIASNLRKPNGLSVIDWQDLPDKLSAFHLQDLPGIGRNMTKRLHKAGVMDVKSLWHLQPKHVRRIWGGVQGERFWYGLHGVDILNPETPKRRTVGHSHVLAPEIRPVTRARTVARRLTLKAASRLRRKGYAARHMSLYARYDKTGRWYQDVSTPLACDNFTFLSALSDLWENMVRYENPRMIKQLGITFYGLVHQDDQMPDMLDKLNDPLRQAQHKHNRLSSAIDEINEKHGLDTVVMGSLPQPMARYTGTKIAFTRIPERAEFHE